MQKTYIFISVLVVAGVAGAIWLNAGNKNIQPIACTMEAKLCPDGTAVGRTGPNCEFAPCPDGTANTNATSTLIKVSSPVSGAVVDKKFRILGEARGTWFFEASFPVQVFDKDGKVIFQTPAQADGDWMTENFVPFHADITIPETYTGPSKLVLKKDNQSGLPEKDASVSVDIVVRGAKIDSASIGTIKGLVTLSPTCPVERMPPDPRCAPKPYQTKIEVFTALSGKLIISTQTGSDGSFSVALPFGNYTIQAGGGIVHPRCSPVDVSLTATTRSIDISCDTGIR